MAGMRRPTDWGRIARPSVLVFGLAGVAVCAAVQPTTAYAQASPVIQAKFQSKEIFMAMVRQGYAVLIQPQRVDFLGAKQTSDGPVFGVQVYARDGSSWIAAYQMVRDESENWRINGCQLMRLSGQQI